MADKKDRGRFTIKFNENDPSHAAVIELLEKQGSHSKAQFIANAILHYVRDTKLPESTPVQALDRAVIEEIVLEILKKQDAGVHRVEKEKKTIIREKKRSRQVPEESADKVEQGNAESVDASMFALIADTMSAFRME